MIKVTCILGRVSAIGEGVVVDDSKAAGNSKRWIFDVEHEGLNPVSFSVQLRGFRTGAAAIPPCILSPHVLPLNQEAAGAKIFFPDPDQLQIEVVSTQYLESLSKDSTVAGGPLRYRVTVDALHSLMR